MPTAIQRVYTVVNAGDVTLTLATEIVVATLVGVTLADPTLNILLEGVAQVTTGVGATTVTPRIRRTSLTGTLVGEANAITTAASSTIQIAHTEEDAPGDVASLVYVLTLTAAGAAGTSLHASLKATLGAQ